MSQSDFQSLVSYEVFETTHDGILLRAQFLSRDDANDYVDRFTSSRSHVYIYRTSCVDVFYPLSGSTETPRVSRSSTPNDTPAMSDFDILETNDYTNMIIRKYGKGYVLVPPQDHPLYGQAYINSNRGKWSSKAEGWFFQRRFLKSFEESGAIIEI